MIGLGADEGRQEAVMNIDDLMGVLFAELRRQDLHVARQHDHIGLMVLDQARDFAECRLLVLRVDRYVVVRDAMPFDHAAQVIVVGNNAGDLAVEFIAVPTVQQIGKAMGLATGHQDHAFFLVGIGDTPDHGEFFGNRFESLTKLLDAKRQRVSTDFVAHEEPAAEIVGMMARFGDPAVIGSQEITDLGNNADAVGASYHQPIGAHEGDSRTSQRRPF
ncbi:hypothetical protein D9M71_463700 [compost metagenome]